MTKPKELPAHSDTLIDEVAATLPQDAPKLLQLHQIRKNRRAMADLSRSIYDIEPLMKRLQTAEDAGGIKPGPDSFQLMADIEDFLRKFAASPMEFDAWIEDGATDEQLVALLATFGKGINPGEANSSLA